MPPELPEPDKGSLSVTLLNWFRIEATGPAIEMVPRVLPWLVIALICLAGLAVFTGGTGLTVLKNGAGYVAGLVRG